MSKKANGIVRTKAGGASPGSAVVLPQLMDLQASQALRDALAQSLAKGAVGLDASQVERMSTPCVQVLLAAGRAADAAAASFTIVNGSDAFRAALADLGVQPDFAKWMA